jgi:ribosome recycling factor
MFDTDHVEKKLDAAVERLEDELKKIRTGRAHADMLDGIVVEVYGTKMPLNQVANITVPEPQLLQVNPFDPSNVQAVAEAIRSDQSLGFNPSDDGKIVRVPLPSLTEERRHAIVKQLGEKVEECRIALRSARQDGLKEAKRMKDAKELSENDVAVIEKEIDRLMAEKQSQVELIAKAKEQEILTI